MAAVTAVLRPFSPAHNLSSSSSSQTLTPFSPINRNPSVLPQLRLTHRPAAARGSRSLLPAPRAFGRRRNRGYGEFRFPDPVPEFAAQEVEKFQAHMLGRLPGKKVCGEHVEEVVGICSEVFSKFLHTEYGGPGTLLVDPFYHMGNEVHKRGLPGASQAARCAIVWAQKHVDMDWKEWHTVDKDSDEQEMEGKKLRRIAKEDVNTDEWGEDGVWTADDESDEDGGWAAGDAPDEYDDE